MVSLLIAAAIVTIIAFEAFAWKLLGFAIVVVIIVNVGVTMITLSLVGLEAVVWASYN